MFASGGFILFNLLPYSGIFTIFPQSHFADAMPRNQEMISTCNIVRYCKHWVRISSTYFFSEPIPLCRIPFPLAYHT